MDAELDSPDLTRFTSRSFPSEELTMPQIAVLFGLSGDLLNDVTQVANNSESFVVEGHTFFKKYTRGRKADYSAVDLKEQQRIVAEKEQHKDVELVPPTPKNVLSPRRLSRWVKCKELPGQVLTLADAAVKCGRDAQSVFNYVVTVDWRIRNLHDVPPFSGHTWTWAETVAEFRARVPMVRGNVTGKRQRLAESSEPAPMNTTPVASWSINTVKRLLERGDLLRALEMMPRFSNDWSDDIKSEWLNTMGLLFTRMVAK